MATVTNYYSKIVKYSYSSNTYSWDYNTYGVHNGGYLGFTSDTSGRVAIFKIHVDTPITGFTFKITRYNYSDYTAPMYLKILRTDTNTTYYNPKNIKSNPDKTFTLTNGGGGDWSSTNITMNLDAGDFYIYCTSDNTIQVYDYYSGQGYNYLTGVTSATSATSYVLSSSAETGSSLTVSINSSPFGRSGNLSNGSRIYVGEVLKFTYSQSSGYYVYSATVDSSSISSGATKTVSNANITVAIKAVRAYTLTKNIGSGASLIVTIKTSTYRSTGAYSGTTLYAGEVIKFKYSVDSSHGVTSATVGSTAITTSDKSFTISGNLTATINTVNKYTLTTSVSHASLTVAINSSPMGRSGNLNTGDPIYAGEVLKFTYSASSGYIISGATYNGTSISSGSTQTVSGNISIVISTATGYTLSSTAGAGATLTVSINSSPFGRSGNLSNGSAIYAGEVLKFTYSIDNSHLLGSATVDGVAFTSGYTKTVSANITVSVTTTGAASLISASNGTFGASLTISLTVYNSAFRHEITAACGSARSTTISVAAGSSSASWTPPTDWMNSFTTVTSTTCTLTCKTYNGDTQVGSNTTKTITLSIPTNATPVINSSSLWTLRQFDNGQQAERAYNTSSSANYLLRNYSKLRVTAFQTSAISLSYSSAISKYEFTFNGTTKTYTNVNSATVVEFPVVAGSSAQTLTLTVTDQRGRAASYSVTISIWSYNRPRLTGISAFRGNSDWTPNPDGTSIIINGTAAFDNINGNSTTFTYVVMQGTTQYAHGTIVNGQAKVDGVAVSSSYTVTVTAQDTYDSNSLSMIIPTSAITIHLQPNGLGVGIGTYVNSDKTLSVGWKMKFPGILRDQIPNGTDLDSIFMSGHYRRMSNSDVATLIHCPTSYGFIMDVYSGNGANNEFTDVIVNYMYITQRIEDYQGNVYMRTGTTGTTGVITWSGWGRLVANCNSLVAIPTAVPNIDQVYDESAFSTTNSGTSGTFPSGASHYGAGLTLTYRKPYGNGKPDYAGQIYIPNGGTGTPNTMFFRTSNANAWEDWQKVASASMGSWVMREVNNRISITSQTCTYYKVGQLVYISIAAWINAGTSSEIARFTLPLPVNSNFTRNYGTVGYFPSSANYPNLHMTATSPDRTFFVFEYGTSSNVTQIKCNQLTGAFQCSMVYITD